MLFQLPHGESPPFEFDPDKSAANRAKHGIDFVEAQALWLDENLRTIPADTAHEARQIVVGRIDGKYWSAVITMRGERVRLISVRRSRPREVRLYEEDHS